MKQSLVPISLFAILILIALNPVHSNEWEMVWSEEFDSEGLPNPEIWSYEIGFIRNNEKQYYTEARPENARVEDGNLIITSRKEDYRDANYTSASIHTWNKKHFQYGRIEVRAQLPEGRGMWPAIWMLGTNRGEVGWPECGEIDIMEFVGYQPDTIHANVHSEKYNHTKNNGKGDKIKINEPFNNFHVYAVEWHKDHMDFYVDDQKYFTYENEGEGWESWPFDQEFYLIINAAIGGSWGGQKGIDDSIFPQTYLVDYVRYYKLATSDTSQ